MVPALALMLVMLTIEIWRYSPSYRPSCAPFIFQKRIRFLQKRIHILEKRIHFLEKRIQKSL
jgi:hypothetical protein